MKFECGDLERALENTELMPEAREHLKHCAECRREYRLWNDISSAARELHQEWESPELWPAIETRLAEVRRAAKRRPWYREPKLWAAAAVLVVAAGFGTWRVSIAMMSNPGVAPNASETNAKTGIAGKPPMAGDRDFLTEQALREVEANEKAYRDSIAKLDRLARPELERSHSLAAANYSEKLHLLDSAIAETRENLAQNRFNTRLQMDLADLYKEKKQTLEDLLTHTQKN